jgi:hypothetical protein
LDPNTTSFSIDVYSAHEKSSIFTYHYSAPALAHPTEGVAKVDSSTIYRIGSVSKLLTVYTYLVAAGDVSFNEPVTKYIPELAAYAKKNAAALETSDIDIFDWNDITVGALASQLSGFVRDFAPNLVSEASLAQFLPPVPDINAKFCGNLAQAQLPCNRSGKLILGIGFCTWYTLLRIPVLVLKSVRLSGANALHTRFTCASALFQEQDGRYSVHYLFSGIACTRSIQNPLLIHPQAFSPISR